METIIMNTLSVAISRDEDAQHDLVLSFGTKGTIISGLSEADLLEIGSAIDCATSKGEDDAYARRFAAPGTWQIDSGYDGAVVYNDCATVAMVPDTLTSWRENARLIAASPDLLRMLKEALQLFGTGTTDANSWEREARGVVAMAEGEA